MKKDWQPTGDDLDRFLKWLDPDTEKAAQTYETIRRRMIVLFTKRGCHLSEDLADEAFNRVMRRLRNTTEGIPGTPVAYLTTVAKHLYLEYVDERTGIEPMTDSDHSSFLSVESGNPGDFDDRIFECLEHCLGKVSPSNRKQILDYYSENKRAKIDTRKQIATGGGLTSNALRIQMCRIRKTLRQCLDDCLQKTSNR